MRTAGTSLSRIDILPGSSRSAPDADRTEVVAGLDYSVAYHFAPVAGSLLKCELSGTVLPPNRCGNATNSRPTTVCLLNAAFAGAADNAGPIVPLPGDAGGRPWLKYSSATQLPSTRLSCLPNARRCNAVDSSHSILHIARRKR